MSVLSSVLSFAVVAGLLTIVPGLDTAMVLRSAIRQGARPAFATALGIGTGALIWGAAAAVGVSALLLTSTIAYTAVRLAGAGYMVWFGLRLILPAVRGTPVPPGGSDPGVEPGETPPSTSLLTPWRRGVMTNLLNPKIGAFYVAVLPQFIPEHSSPLLMGILLALVHDLEGLLWFSVIILMAGRMTEILRRRAAHRVVDGATGSALVGFGIKLGLVH
jgi:threonine/homoserine/homoserine lactone efflux protein